MIRSGSLITFILCLSPHVSLDSRSAKPKQKIWGGERIEILPQPGPSETAHRPERIALDIVYEDD